jgi:HEPN domain-containing protein
MLKDMVKNYIEIDNEDIFEDLNSLYIESRYPSDMGLLPYGKPTLEDAKEFYNFANKLFIKVCILLKIDMQEIKTQ